ncbi:amidase [Nocardioides sp. LHG3406-4]|uniref:amidase n=1 Tax=Nocardioides sp. LHG3406-4 TaxID=2804575 RepID=UPI003CED584C
MLHELDIPGPAGGPLTGLRVAVKDVIDVAGVPTSAGSPAWAESHEVPENHAGAVQALLTAGAIIAGKAVSDELAFSVHGTNPHYGMPPNPAAPGHIPGGSSSGSASAVASGDVDIALGSDTGGSVRVPASYCGIFGVRPSWARSDTSGVVPLAPSFDTVGWFARDAATLERVGEVLLASSAVAPDALILVPLAEAFEVARADVAADVLAGLTETFGASVTAPRSLGFDLYDLAAVRYRIQTFETWQAHGEWGAPRLAQLGRGVRARLEASAHTTQTEYDDARRRRDEICQVLEDRVGPDEVLCLPTTPTPAPALDRLDEGSEERRTGVFALGAIAGLWGSPEVTVPGVRTEGVPVGTSLVGRPGDDLRLLAFLRQALA